MPELPEVETVTRDLRELVVGRRVVRVDLRDSQLVRRPSPAEFARRLAGQTFIAASRVAKVALLALSSGDYLAIQLMVTGQLILHRPDDAVAASTRLILDLDDGSQLRMNDDNGYAKVLLLPQEDLAAALRLDRLGPDPTAPDFSLEAFRARIRGRRGRLKPLLLDQGFLAGLGNIYVDEALFRARIHPGREVKSLSEDEVERLYAAIREVLSRGIELRGTTIATYRDVRGRKGGFQQELRVFRRKGKPCFACNTRISVTDLAGRDTHFCPHCQPAATEPAPPLSPRLL